MIKSEQYRESFESLDPGIILDKQNDFSSTDTGYIWVLNTSVFIVADYNFSLDEKFGITATGDDLQG